jgi:ubiquinone/menaquinone biosynthesis C-methylase UbiE
MVGAKTYISIGDFVDLYYKMKEKGYNKLLSKFHLSNQARTVSKWNDFSGSSDFWIIPQVRKRWNEKCTGNPNLEYEDYFVNKYLAKSSGLRMLSIGCGTGSKERNFGKYKNFEKIEGVDLAPNQIEEARKFASDLNLDNIEYIVADFETYSFVENSYDIILFHSSLHHFNNVQYLLEHKVMPLLKKNGYLVIHEYVGPKRLQWTKLQLEFSNKLLKELPPKYRLRFKTNATKNKIYRPGLLRMLAIDPSEAIDSESIIPSIHKLFKVIEENKIGWNITHLLFKDIAHNFLNNESETESLLLHIFEQEDKFLEVSNRSDAIFGIYQKA